MKTWLVAFLILTLSLNIYAQKEEKPKKGPSLPEAVLVYKRAVSSFRSKNYDRCQIQLDSVINLYQQANMETTFAGDAYYLKGLTYNTIKKRKEALLNLQLAEKVYQDFDSSYYFLPSVYLEISKTHLNDLDKSFFFLEKRLKISEKIYANQPTKLAEAYSEHAGTLIRRGQYQKANTFYNKIKKIAETNPDKKITSLYSAFNVEGINHKNNGAYFEAIESYEKAIRILEEDSNQKSYAYSLVLNNLGVAYKYFGEYERSLEYYRQAEVIVDSIFGAKNRRLATIKCNKGLIYIRQDKIKKAIEEFEERIEIVENGYGKKSVEYLEALFNLSHANIEDENYEQAGSYLDSAEVVSIELFGNDSKMRAEVLSYKADLYTAREAFGLAQNTLMEAQGILGLDRNQMNVAHLDNKKLFVRSFWKLGTAFSKEYEKKGDLKILEQSLKEYLYAIETLNGIRKGRIHKNSKLMLTEEFYELFSLAINVAWTLFEKTEEEQYVIKALNISENSKSILLGDEMSNTYSLTTGGVPNEFLDELSSIDYEIDVLEKRIDNVADDEILSSDLKDRILDAKEARENWYLDIEKKYPKFYQLKSQVPQLSVSYIRKDILKKGMLSVEYFLDKEHLFVMSISQEKVHLRKIEMTKELLSQINQFCFGKTKKQPLSEGSSYDVFSNILEPELKIHGSVIDELIIIPDGVLRFLPFDLLHLEKENDRFLIHSFAIRYLNALHIEQFELKNRNNYQKAFAGFAPSYKSFNQDIAASFYQGNTYLSDLVRSGIYELPGAQKEVLAIADIYHGDIYLEEEASETNFKRNANLYQVLHLSMHTIANDEIASKSSLIFQNDQDINNDGFLELEEIYNLDFNADLAVLSACNTGFGKQKKGEGVMSLSHAFNYAGVPSTVMSLWKVPDESTSQIMISFYKYLKSGASKSKALQQAKLDYLDNVIAPEQKHPYYWAGFVLSGNNDPIDFDRGWSLNAYVFLALLGIALFWFFRKKR